MQYDFSAIPDEMKDYHQFVCWRYEERGEKKPAKVPYSPRTGRMASVTDPSTWCNYDEAVKAANAGIGYDGIGFVLTKNDPYAFIDLDDTEGNAVNFARQLKVHQEFDSYSEKSPSGNGLHIIVKANIPDGRRRSHIELYDDKRYMTMTGNVYNNKPIMERAELTNLLWQQMGGTPPNPNCYAEADEKYTDDEITAKGLAAANAEKFRILFEGRWNELYTSQSEADLALINIIAFYTQNRGQIKRIFRASSLGSRDKAKREDYLEGMITKAFDNILPPIDIVGITEKVENFVASEKAKSTKALATSYEGNSVAPPKGLLPAIAQFVYDSSPYVVWEIAWAAALALMAGICGRSYNVSGTGLNLYILLLAPTGTGKESIKRGITKLLTYVSPIIPMANDFMGPGHIASAPALVKHIADSTTASFVSILSEVGLLFKQLTSEKANATQTALLSTFLDLYHLSGKDDVLHATVYSDRSKNVAPIKSPAFTFVGESVPDTFYEAIDERMISSGLLPRLTIIEYNGRRPEPNEKHHEVIPSDLLINGLTELMVLSLEKIRTLSSYNKQTGFQPYQVRMSEDAEQIMREFRKFVDEEMRKTETNAVHHLWNRAHLKALKYAAIGAISENPCNPVITTDLVQWAKNNVINEISNMLQRFESGDIGKDSSELKQMNHMKKVLRDYFMNGANYAITYGGTNALYEAKIIPRKYLYKRISNLPAFKNDTQKASGALDRCVSLLISIGVLKRCEEKQLKDFDTTQQAYLLLDVTFVE